MRYGLQQRDIDCPSRASEEFLEIEEVVLFGSRVKGNYKKASDIENALILKRTALHTRRHVSIPVSPTSFAHASFLSPPLVRPSSLSALLLISRRPLQEFLLHLAIRLHLFFRQDACQFILG
jgi:Nucleotidyltransferase domain